MSQNPANFLRSQDVNYEHLFQLCKQSVALNDYPYAHDCKSNVLIYNASLLADHMQTERINVLSELHRAISDNGPGVIVIKGAYSDPALLSRFNKLFESILIQEREQKTGGDHFATAGANGRIWNALQKVALQAPVDFIEYYKNPALGWVADAWLGPYWQMTSQVNVVHPGANAQHPHRDYHLGFQSNAICESYPLSIQKLSSALTLQGAVAHTDMPLASGPTKLLPFSHQYDLGYLAWRDPDVVKLFEQEYVQLALQQGDLLFFNPALIHAAGSNQTADLYRTANLLQISSSFSKPMESINREAMCQTLYGTLCHKWQTGQLDEEALKAVVACTADGYSFPTNLDLDPPYNEAAPQTQQQHLLLAIQQNTPAIEFFAILESLRSKRLA
ncbi:phytanoyl-CoA dioxygenase family protein [Pseudoalteromonas sp. 5-MNA-CIBAN-0065]|uniref:phytanoyl-CoA dioxygenase family protein n=1 Tax=Pseudoalteromonas sp. 5-MNA-CIBAN-0065 TaxID=3140421 RepID=UPI00332EE595